MTTTRHPARVLLTLLAMLPASPAHQEDAAPPAIPLEPGSKDAQPLTVYQWTAETGATDLEEGLRYTWSLPADFERTRSYDLVVICHGTGLDYRWGHANYPVKDFRPRNIVVSVDGTSEADDGSRLFLGTRADAIEFRDFILEIGRALPVDRIFLYGHSQGSFFVLYFAGQFPGIVQGVVAHASGAWVETNLEGGIQGIPIAFMHGTADPVIPYAQSVGARDAFLDAGHTMLTIRRMHAYNHWPNAVRASECLDWCSGMSTLSADTALADAYRMLTPKPPDQYNYTCPLPFGAAAQVLRRITGEAEHPVEDATDAQKARAEYLLGRINALGASHVEVLRKDLSSADDFVLGLGEGEGAWLGHLVSLREDFRDVPSVEEFIADIGYDDAVYDQREAAGKLMEIWFANRPDKYRFEVVGNTLGDCFLVDTIPADLHTRMAELRKRAEELGLTEESLEKYGIVEAWATAWKNGYARYRELCDECALP